MHCRPPTSTLFPYTTLFRSRTESARTAGGEHAQADVEPEPDLRRADHEEPAMVLLDLFAHRLRQLCGGVVLQLGPEVVDRSEEHTSELQSLTNLVCRLLLEK